MRRFYRSRAPVASLQADSAETGQASLSETELTEMGAPEGGPQHVAIIMDGNGRWAKARRLPRLAGHRAGVEAVRRVVRAAPKLGIKTLTLYTFSSENWRRPAEEVSDLMGLLHHHLMAELDELHENGVRLQLIGNWRALKPDLVARLEKAIDRTKQNNRLNLVIALNYGGQDELVRAFQGLAQQVAKGELLPENITSARVEQVLDTAHLPAVDLIVRTSGEQRLSNFLLWQAAYAELWFTETLWPDFDDKKLSEAVHSFAMRDRRYGGR